MSNLSLSIAKQQRERRAGVLGRRMAKSVRNAGLGAILLVLLGLMAFFPDLFATHNPLAIRPVERLQPPSAQHYFGTDHLGRDVFSRVVHGTRISLGAALATVVLAGAAGTVVGVVAGMYGGRVDNALMRVADVFLAFPYMILAMGIAALLGRSVVNMVLGLAGVWWSQYARLVRNQVLSLRGQAFIEAAEALGVSRLRILFRHVLPNVMSSVIVKASLDCGQAVLATASLSFIGLGAAPPAPEWGAMITDARSYILDAWWIPTFPGLAIFAAVLGFNLIGDRFRDRVDPRYRA